MVVSICYKIKKNFFIISVTKELLNENAIQINFK